MARNILSGLRPPEELSSEGADHFQRYVRAIRSRRVASVLFRVCSFVLVIAALAALIGLVLEWAGIRGIAAGDGLLGILWLAMPFYFISMILGTSAGRDRDLGIVLLRPFGEPQLTRALKRAIKRTIGPIGYVYTLSDRHYKPDYFYYLIMSPAGIFGFALAAVFRPSVRLGHVSTQNSLDNLEYQALRRKGFPSFWSFISGEQAFNFSSSDDWWQASVRSLARLTDFSVMDISKVGAGSTWEIEYLRTTGRWQTCVFIVQEEYASQGQDILRSAFGDEASPLLNVYRRNGAFIVPEMMEDCLTAALINGLLWRRAIKRCSEGIDFFLEDWERADGSPEGLKQGAS